MAHKVYQGDDWKFDFQYKINGNAKDITGAQEIRCCVKAAIEANTVEVKKSTSEIVITDSVAGRGYIKIPKTKTELIKTGVINLLLELTDVDGDESTEVFEKFLDVKVKSC